MSAPEPARRPQSGDVHGTAMSCAYCRYPVVLRSFQVGPAGADSWIVQADPHFRPDGSGMCHEQVAAGRLARAVDIARLNAAVESAQRTATLMLDRLGLLVEGNVWPCHCPDSYLDNGVVANGCPRHELGPALMAEMTAMNRPTIPNTRTAHDCPIPEGAGPGYAWTCTCGAHYVLGATP